MKPVVRTTLAGAVTLALSPLAQGGQEISFDGTQYYSAHLENVQLETGHTYALLKEWRGIHASTDAANVTNRIRLECTGYFDSRADGTFSAEGYCNHWDRDGDLWVGHWWNNSKMPAGRYEVFAGQGKYAGATGGGTANCMNLKPSADPQVVCEITGTIKLK